jgi:hypothetical protein
MTAQVQYEWGLYVNCTPNGTGDRTVDIVKSSYKEDPVRGGADDDFGGDTVVKTIPWMEGCTYEEQMELTLLAYEEKGYLSFIEVN